MKIFINTERNLFSKTCPFERDTCKSDHSPDAFGNHADLTLQPPPITQLATQHPVLTHFQMIHPQPHAVRHLSSTSYVRARAGRKQRINSKEYQVVHSTDFGSAKKTARKFGKTLFADLMIFRALVKWRGQVIETYRTPELLEDMRYV